MKVQGWFTRRREPHDWARDFMVRQGVDIRIERWETSAGRIDFLLREGSTLVVVHVRVRGTCHDGDEEREWTSAELQTIREECRIRFPAESWESMRHDVLRLDWYGSQSRPVIRYFPGAISARESACELAATS